MKHYLVSYDLEQPPAQRDYKPLIDRLESLGAVRVLYSEWLLKNSASAAAIRDDLNRFTLPQDRLLVVALDGEAAWRNLDVSNEKVTALMS